METPNKYFAKPICYDLKLDKIEEYLTSNDKSDRKKILKKLATLGYYRYLDLLQCVTNNIIKDNTYDNNKFWFYMAEYYFNYDMKYRKDVRYRMMIERIQSDTPRYMDSLTPIKEYLDYKIDDAILMFALRNLLEVEDLRLSMSNVNKYLSDNVIHERVLKSYE